MLFSGVCILRSWNTINRLRDDLLWSCERDMFASLRHSYEIYRTIPNISNGGGTPSWSHRVAAHLETKP